MHEDKRSLQNLRDALSAKKLELSTRIERRRSEIAVDGDPDDEGARAVGLASRDFAAFNMELEMKTLEEIDSSLRRIDSGEYGICSVCAAEIPSARLKALPWTRLCLVCAETSRRPAHSGAAGVSF
jgi:RNA polymerase-binding transcription factor